VVLLQQEPLQLSVCFAPSWGGSKVSGLWLSLNFVSLLLRFFDTREFTKERSY
jgi:hypothetical protein